MHVQQLEAWLARGGWHLTRSRGSHRQYRNAETGQRLTLALHGRKVSAELLENLLKDLQQREQEAS